MKGWVPNCYSHVQSFYWHNGLFSYWSINNIPNFLLASPMLCVSAWLGRRAWKDRDRLLRCWRTQLNLIVALLGLFCLFTMNVQVRALILFVCLYFSLVGCHSVSCCFSQCVFRACKREERSLDPSVLRRLFFAGMFVVSHFLPVDLE